MFAWSVFIPFVLIGSLTPGPNNLLALHNGSRYGYRQTIPFVLGVTCGVFLLLLGCALLALFMRELVPGIREVTRWAGAVYLVYLAVRIMISKPPAADSETADSSSAASFPSGVLLQLVNAKAIAYGMVIFAAMVTPVYSAWWQILLFVCGLCLLTFAAVSIWAAGGALLSGVLNRYYRMTNLLLGGVLLYTAFSMAFTAL